MQVRSTLYALGYRFRLHRSDLPGKPDLVLSSRGKVVFVHGCFWHGHSCRRGRGRSKSNVEFWNQKIDTNQKRDRHNIAALRKLGWGVALVWECQLQGSAWISRLIRFLGPVSP